MDGGAHPSPSAAFCTFPELNQMPTYCRVDRDSFSVAKILPLTRLNPATFRKIGGRCKHHDTGLLGDDDSLISYSGMREATNVYASFDENAKTW